MRLCVGRRKWKWDFTGRILHHFCFVKKTLILSSCSLKLIMYISISQSGERFHIKRKTKFIFDYDRAWEFSCHRKISIKTFLFTKTCAILLVGFFTAWKILLDKGSRLASEKSNIKLCCIFVHLFTTNFYILQNFSFNHFHIFTFEAMRTFLGCWIGQCSVVYNVESGYN